MLEELRRMLPDDYNVCDIDAVVNKKLATRMIEDCVYSIYITVRGLDSEDTDIDIVTLHIQVVPNYLCSDSDIVMILDNISQELHDVAQGIGLGSELIAPFDFYLSYHNLVYLNKIEVNKAFRGRGVGTYILSQLQELLEEILDDDIEFILLNSCPYECVGKKDEAIMRTRLVEFYKRAGFVLLPDNYSMYKEFN